jgi:hypothetical protein
MAVVLAPAWATGVPRGAWRARVRAELGDEATPYLWSDGLLDGWLGEALAEYERAVPREAAAELASVAGEGRYALPGDVLAVVRVEHPAGVERVRARAGEGGAGTYDVWGGQLVLAPAPGQTGEPIRLRYLGRRAAPRTDAEALPVAVGEEERLVLYVCARALVWISTQEGKRQAFERTRGADALALAGWYEARYREALRARAGATLTTRAAPPRQLVVRED